MKKAGAKEEAFKSFQCTSAFPPLEGDHTLTGAGQSQTLQSLQGGKKVLVQLLRYGVLLFSFLLFIFEPLN